MEPKTLIKRHSAELAAIDQKIDLALIELLVNKQDDYFTFRDKAMRAIKKEMQGIDMLVRRQFREMVDLAREKSSVKGSKIDGIPSASKTLDLSSIVERRATEAIDYIARRNVIILNRCMDAYQSGTIPAEKGFTYGI